MEFLRGNLLTILILLPALGAIVTLFAKGRDAIRWSALATCGITFLASLLLFATFDWHQGSGYAYAKDGGTVQMVQVASWIPAFNVEYRVGIDGLSFPLVILTTLIFLLSCIASWKIDKMLKGYMVLFLLLESGILGVFLSLDFFLFYVFFEVSLVPMYFLIGIWGGARKEYAAIKFFLYTLVGSIALLIVLIGTYLYSKQITPDHLGTFDLVRLSSPAFHARFALLLDNSPHIAPLFFVLLMIGFLIKVPGVPLHTWLPDAHVEAPTPVSMILAAVLLKVGGYGIFRIAYPLYPQAAKSLWLLFAIIGVVSIIYGALCAMSQTDFKRLVAYSSISHMGFVVLGAAVMTEAAMNGAIFMMIAHGITSAMMFFVVGVVYDRAYHRELSRLGGLANTMPIYTGLSSVAFFANLGLPGLCGFIGEVMVLLGTFGAAKPGGILYEHFRAMGDAALHGYVVAVYTLAVIACFGMILTAGYMLWTIQRVFFGPERSEYKSFPEITPREITVLAPLAVMAIALGILPTLMVFVFTNPTVAALKNLLGSQFVIN